MSTKILTPCATVLLAAIVGLAIADNARPWKRLQIEFFELARQQLRIRLAAARAGLSDTLLEGIRSQEALLAARDDEIVELEDDLRRFRGKSRAAEQRRNRLRSQLEVARWHRDTGGSEPAATSEIGPLIGQLRQARMEIESLGELIADRERKLAAARLELDAAREQLAGEHAAIEALESRLAELPAPPLIPLAGVLAPGVSVREISFRWPVEGGPRAAEQGDAGRRMHPEARRVDRCVTCHLGAVPDRVESDDWAPPFRGHPRRELFVGADSPHPYQRFGCTICHGGEGRATDFSRAGHQPATSEQAAAWAESRGWSRQQVTAAMLPLDLIEAACGRCHGGSAFVPQAQQLDLGRQLIETLGCTACHASEHPSLRALPRVGPSLIGIAGKTSRAWVYRWLEAPHAQRPSTRMPHFFDHREASADGEPWVSGRERAAETRAVVEALWKASNGYEQGISTSGALGPSSGAFGPAGEVESGRVLFNTIGCSACHLLGPEDEPSASIEQRHGPLLAGIGSKVAAGWLYSWLLNPRAYSRDTRMPSLRLSKQEAADITAYLMTRRDPAWENLSLPTTDVETRDRLVLSALARDHTLEQSQARLEGMSEADKNVYLGERTIAGYGCHGCHEIAGLEPAAAIGPTLDEIGRELRSVVAGREPRTRGRWQASSHRPAYRLADDDVRAVTVALLGLSEDHGGQDEPTSTLAQGRRVLTRYNCRGCHRIEGRGGTESRARATSPGGVSPGGIVPDGAAPDLTDIGVRLKAPWLFAHLGDPGRVRVRPWLAKRMPSFGLSEAESNALVRYFAARDGRSLFADEPPAPRPEADIAVGRVVFGMLQCADCHRSGDEEAGTVQLAPSHGLASERLRPEWVVACILDPQRWLPGATMPANFLQGEGDELDSGFLVGSIDMPIFDVDRELLVRLLGSEEALRVYLSNPERVATALRDYLWTLGK